MFFLQGVFEASVWFSPKTSLLAIFRLPLPHANTQPSVHSNSVLIWEHILSGGDLSDGEVEDCSYGLKETVRFAVAGKEVLVTRRGRHQSPGRVVFFRFRLRCRCNQLLPPAPLDFSFEGDDFPASRSGSLVHFSFDSWKNVFLKKYFLLRMYLAMASALLWQPQNRAHSSAHRPRPLSRRFGFAPVDRNKEQTDRDEYFRPAVCMLHRLPFASTILQILY